MKTFCVSYDLRCDDRNYEPLRERLLDLNGENILESVWVLELPISWTCKMLKEYLKKYISEDEDGLFIAEIKDEPVLINPIID